MTKELIAVVGSTGKTGRRVHQELVWKGHDVRGLARSTKVPFDWERPQGWEAALTDVNRAYVTFAPDLAVPEAVDAITQFARTAHACGVQRVVLLSGRGEPEAQRAEQALRSIIPDTTVISSSFLMQNFSEGAWLDDVRRGAVPLPATEVREPFVDAGDIAAVAVKALLDDDEDREVIEITGPQLMTFAEAVDVIAWHCSHEVQYIGLPLDDYLIEAKGVGVPEPIVDLLAYLFGEVMDGRNESVVDTVERELGRPATPFLTFAESTSRSGVWGAPTP